MTERKSFDQLLAEGSVVLIGDKSYDIAALPAEEWAAFIGHFKRQNLRLLFDSSSGVNPAIVSATAAKVTVGAWTDADIIEHSGTIEGAAWIMERSLELAGNAKPKEVIAQVPHGLLIDKAAIVLQLSGLVRWRADAENPPTESTGGTQ